MEQKGKYQTQVKSVFISNFPNTVNYGTFFTEKKDVYSHIQQELL